MFNIVVYRTITFFCIIIVKTGPRLEMMSRWLIAAELTEGKVASSNLWIQKVRYAMLGRQSGLFYPHFVSYLSIFTGAYD